MKIRLERGDFGTYLLKPVMARVRGFRTDEMPEDILIQTDFDFPGTASTFGWSPCHRSTDGTVNCPDCGKTATEMISEAAEFLDKNIGAVADDPGYFN